MRSISLFFCFFFCLIFATPSFAGWHTTKWGMNKQEVEGILKEKLIKLAEDKFGVKEDVTLFNFSFSFFVEIPKQGLKSVSFIRKDRLASSVCVDIFKQLDEEYGRVAMEKNKNQYIFAWNDGDTDIIGVLDMPDFGKHQCMIFYTPEKAIITR